MAECDLVSAPNQQGLCGVWSDRLWLIKTQRDGGNGGESVKKFATSGRAQEPPPEPTATETTLRCPGINVPFENPP